MLYQLIKTISTTRESDPASSVASALLRRFAIYVVIAAGLTGCAGMPFAKPVESSSQNQMTQKEPGETGWRDQKEWLLSRLPKAEHLVQGILSALKEYPDGDRCSPDSSGSSDCERLFAFLRRKMSPYELRRVSAGSALESFALIDADTAYFFRVTDWTFSGIADLSNSLYFAVPDVPLRRTDGRSFAFAADGRTDQATVWTLYRGDVIRHDSTVVPVGENTITRTELEAAGVPKQIDLLTPQQRGERELAKQGETWLRRAQMKAMRTCSDKPESDKFEPFGFGGKRKHGHGRDQGTSVADKTADTTSMAEALEGKAHLNCSTGSGYVVTEDGVAGEVHRLTRNRDGADVVISATAKEIAGGIISYRYPAEQGNFDVLNPAHNKEMEMQIETTKGGNRLNLMLRSDTGAIAGTLLLPGDWYMGPGYRIRGKDLSTAEFAELFLRTYRDCAVKDSQGACKSIPDIFISFLNPQNASEFVQYVADHYLSSNTEKGR